MNIVVRREESLRHPGGPEHELQTLFRETTSLFHCLQVAAAAVHKQDQLTASMRGVLLGLVERGPQTVPHMARLRPTSRQHIQVIVNRLLDAGLVSTVDNPDHRRSKLVRLTATGKRTVAAMQSREAALFARADIPVTAAEVASAAQTLRSVRATLVGGRFRDLLHELAPPDERGD